MRDETQRKISAAYIKMLESSRMTPTDISANIEALKQMRDTSRDPRVRARAAEALQKHYAWQAEYEMPVTQKIQHQVEFPSEIKIELVSGVKKPGKV